MNDKSLLDEIEELQVLEAEELQEGVAFHAFRFRMPVQMEAIVLTLRGKAESLVDGLKLPPGATLTDVVDDKMRIMYDPDSVKSDTLKKLVIKSLGRNLADVDYEEASKVRLVKRRP